MATRIDKKRHMKACIPCAKLKIRCEFAPYSQKCNRCVRLCKECLDQAPGAHSKPNKRARTNHESEIRRLESIVDSMSQLVSARTTGTPPASVVATTTANLSAVRESRANGGDSSFGQEEGFRCIKLYAEEIAPMFPFVVVRADTDAEQLCREKPLLYQCLLMVTCQNDVRRQTKLAREIGDDIGRCLGRREKSLAMLQAILIYVGWTHVHQHPGAGLLIPMHLAMAMVSELGIDQEARPKSKISAGALRGIGKNEPPPARTLEERRAYLGVLWMASMINACFHSMVTPRFTQYTEDCRRVLEAAQEAPNDVYAVELIRLLRLLHSVDQVVYQDALSISSEMTVPLAMAIGALQKEVMLPTQFKPPAAAPVQAILAQLAQQMLELHLCKLSIEDDYFPAPSSHTAFRADLLVACLSTVETLLGSFCRLPGLAVLSLPYGYWGMVGHAIKMYARVCEVQYGSWTPAVDGRAVFGRLAQKMEDANAAGQQAAPPRRMPEFYEQVVAKLKELGEAAANTTRRGASPAGEGSLGHDAMGGILLDLLDWA